MKNTLKLRLKVGMILFMFITGTQFLHAKGIDFRHLKLAEARETAQKSGKIVFVDVFAEWCGPCKYLSKNVFTEESVGSFFNENFISIKIDGEKGEGPEIMDQFEIDAFPTMLFISSDGKLLKKTVGAKDPESLINIANGIVHPEETALYKMKLEYDQGNREKDFLIDYLLALLEDENEEDETEKAVLNEITDRYPDLDLEDQNDFLVFLLGVNDIDSPLMQDYLNNINKYEELHGEFLEDKFIIVISTYIESTARSGDKERLLEVFEVLFSAIQKAEYTSDYDELKATVLESYESSR